MADGLLVPRPGGPDSLVRGALPARRLGERVETGSGQGKLVLTVGRSGIEKQRRSAAP